MRHLNDFKEIYSYDFDGTLHLTVDRYGNPLDFYMDVALLLPNYKMLGYLKLEAVDFKIVVVSARNIGDEDYIMSFCKLHKLPVADVYCTNNRSKLPVLQRLNALKHVDDNPKVEADLKGSDIRFFYPVI
jgi:hypothetical protein